MLIRSDGHLNQRGRLLRTGLALAIMISALIVGPRAFAADQGSESGDAPLAYDTYTVVEGETLWSIANDVAGDGSSTRETLSTIQQLNGLSGSIVMPGQQLRVPRG